MSGKQKLARFIVRARVLLMIALLALAGWSATTVSRTNINYDLIKYLSEDTMTRRSMTVMQEEFGSAEQLRIMFADLSGEALSAVLEKLNSRDEILIAAHNPAQDVRVTDGKTMQLVTITLSECDASVLAEELRSMFPEAGEYCVGGSAAEMMDIQRSVAREIPGVMLICVGIVLLVLLLTSHAWLEPVVILVTLAVSILINMGTNFIFPDVSFITFAVCAILQLALSIDYAIMLLHTWNACRDEGMSAKDAMTEALAQCFMRITSSAMTTVAGLLSLIFMSYTIGFDIGVVLSKGIVISMLGVFLFMPSLALLMERSLKATRHKPLPVGGQHLAKAVFRARKPLAVLLIAAVAAGAVLASLNTYTFSSRDDPESKTDTARINRVFGSWDPLVLLVPGGQTDEEYDRQRELVAKLQELRRPGGEAAVAGITAMVTDCAPALEYYTVQDVSAMMNMPEAVVRLFFLTQGFGSQVRADRLLASAGVYAAGNETIAGLRETLESARSALEGPNYARIAVMPAFRSGDADFNSCMESVLSAVRSVYGDRFFVTGMPMSSYDIGNAFRGDLLRVNLITLLSILLIVAVSFRSFRLPVMLVLVIEGAIWITMGISRLMGEPIFFVCYLICLSIQMGATIDYGILMCDQYRTVRRTGLPVREALTEAMHRSLPTILTSGIILVTAGYVVGRYCSIYYISSIGSLLSRGAFISAVLVLTLLPALLALLDRFVIRTKKRS